MQSGFITVKGARVHNLKNIDVSLPRDKLIVITGLSGCGKSSLAFDTIYAEGQRRYVESLSAYARQFLELQEKPDVDLIEGLSPAISIEQKTTSKNPRSTVATVTEIYDYFRLLFARVGKPHCYNCQKPISQKSANVICDEILESCNNIRISILSPIIRNKKGEHKSVLEQARKEGFVRVRINNELRLLEEDIDLNPKQKHNIDLVIDRMLIENDQRARLNEALELALKKSLGLVIIIKHQEENTEDLFSEHFSCIDCGISLPNIEPRMFSFNAPDGACKGCGGLGELLHFTKESIVNEHLSLMGGAIKPYASNIKSYYYQQVLDVAKAYDADINTPFAKLSKKIQEAILHGSDKKINFVFKSDTSNKTHKFNRVYEGLINQLQKRYTETQNETIRQELEYYMLKDKCSECLGSRLRQEARYVTISNKAIHEITAFSIKDALNFFTNLKLSDKDLFIAKAILKEICSRLSFLDAVGLDYLQLNRAAKTLSGGEAQRIRLATQIGSALVGVLYVLDEPSIGLHQRDNEKLIKTLQKLRDLGNTVLVVEHDEDTILAADYVVDMGPYAGVNGGEIVVCGTPKEIMQHKTSLTTQYLTRKLSITPVKKRLISDKKITINNAHGNNLKNITVSIPLGVMTGISGVSGSGKSSLIIDTLYAKLASYFGGLGNKEILAHDSISGIENIDKLIDIDQSPIGRTPRSNPVTYTGVFDLIRALFAQLPQAQARGFGPGRFSFNVKGGRCESCMGAGVVTIEMNFLPDVHVVCEECKGKRFNKSTLEILYKDKSIADILHMTIEEASNFFINIPQIHKKLEIIKRVGLGYLQLGQSATTLSGGEAQRIKLSKELFKKPSGKTLYILDEPTTGLHFHDVNQLLNVLQELVDQGNSMIIIEHNLDVIKSCDYIIDLGPEGGDKGGEVVAVGTPDEIINNNKSYTGQFLKDVLKRDHAKS